MQVTLNSNSASLVQNTLTKNGSNVQSLAYSTNTSFPNVSKKCSVVSPYISFTGAPDNNSDTFNVPRSNMWYLGRLQFKATNTLATGDQTAYVGLNIIRSIDLVCNGQPVMTMSGEALKAIVMNSSGEFQDFTYRYALPLVQATEVPAAIADTTWTSYVPLFGSWFTAPEKALDCSKLEQLQLVVTYKTRAESGLTNGITALSAKLHTYKYLPDSETYNKMVVQNMQNPLLECFNTITERQQMITSISTTQVFTSNIFYPVYKTHVFIAKQGTAGTAPAAIGCPYVNIESLSLDIGGENYYTDFTKSMINYEQAIFGFGNRLTTSATAISRNASQIITIDWSLLGDRKSNSGLASMANLNRPQYTIKTPNATLIGGGDAVGDYWLYVVHEYWNILEIDPASKVLAIRASH